MPTDSRAAMLVEERNVDFEWSPGYAVSQKQKSIRSFHQGSAEMGISPVLEVSTKSPDPLGMRLSAFNLEVSLDNRAIPLEAAFQGSKVFKHGGPFTDLYNLDGTAIKRDERLHESGSLVAFEWIGERWPLEPKTAFYDWLYINALDSLGVGDDLARYEGFTDIEFNPAKSINCQARSCALFVSLRVRGVLRDVLDDTPHDFRQLLSSDLSKTASQDPLFET